ncbi:MAG: lectin-like domain-containing protein [Rhodoglobus sp.]
MTELSHPFPFSARDRRRVIAALTATIIAAALALGVGGSSSAATVVLSETFSSNTVSSAKFTTAGNFTPCLTAPGGAGSVPSSCAAGATDVAGSGVLRLTSTAKGAAGAVMFDSPLPTRAGLDVSFTQYQWGGTGADGISFFLIDGRYALDELGASGENLGYNTGGTGALPGLPHALLGVGMDAHGNFPLSYNDPNCEVQPSNPGRVPEVLAVRGPAGDVTSESSSSGYCLLAQGLSVSGMRSAAADRPAGTPVRITVDPPSQKDPKVKVYWGADVAAGIPTMAVAVPSIFAATPTVKLGWASSSGSLTDHHEISRVSVKSFVSVGAGVTTRNPA